MGHSVGLSAVAESQVFFCAWNRSTAVQLIADQPRLVLITDIKSICLDCAILYASDVGAVNLYIILRIAKQVSQNLTGRGNFSGILLLFLSSSDM